MVSGSVAAILYGEPRLTHDVDFVVVLRSEDIDRLRQAFPVPEFYLGPPGWSAWVRSRTNPARDAEDIRELVVNVRQPNRDDHGQETSADFLNFISCKGCLHSLSEQFPASIYIRDEDFLASRNPLRLGSDGHQDGRRVCLGVDEVEAADGRVRPRIFPGALEETRHGSVLAAVGAAASPGHDQCRVVRRS